MLRRIIGPITFWKVVFFIILGLGLYSTYIRFFHGLGPSTALSDEMPWGIWIGFNIFVGIGLAAGGFTIAAIVHIFHIHRYESIARPVILTAFLGYLSAVTALIFEVGQPWRLWHPIIMWNPHSVLFEVAWCVMLYTTVLALEFSPIVFEQFNLKVPMKIVRIIYIPLVIAGVLLSTLHQSSLGTLYVIAPDKLHPLWYSPFLPVYFFISAIGAGLALTIFESYLCKRAFGKSLRKDLLQGLTRVIVVVIAVYLAWRFIDLDARGNLKHVFSITTESVLFWGEIGLGFVLPFFLFMNKRIIRSDGGMFFAATLTIMGFMVNRMNVAMTGMAASSGVSYIPSWEEFSITIMAPAISFALFALAAKYLPVFSEDNPTHLDYRENESHGPSGIVFNPKAVAGFWVFLLIGIVSVGYATKNQDKTQKPDSIPSEIFESVTWSPEISDLKLPPDYTFPMAEDSMGPVTFSHQTHLQSGKIECASCHRSLFMVTQEGTPVTGELTNERIHEGSLCASCHNGEMASDTQEDCDACHK